MWDFAVFSLPQALFNFMGNSTKIPVGFCCVLSPPSALQFYGKQHQDPFTVTKVYSIFEESFPGSSYVDFGQLSKSKFRPPAKCDPSHGKPRFRLRTIKQADISTSNKCSPFHGKSQFRPRTMKQVKISTSSKCGPSDGKL